MIQAAHNKSKRATIQVSPACHKLLKKLAEREVVPVSIGTLIYRLAAAEAERARSRTERRAARRQRASARDAAQPVQPQRLQDEQDQPPVPVAEQET